ncbi:uncharacterized protein A1O5_12676 [Cladophialophora psammophila CBS 110553]|uniref:Uncharacterized protein n=1 Tax=Cladophialophora psammophila CBS 110553 TaxID=1182543 RepID=W9VT56_9EURO|nr:uncharacterized protein A1O5_12676 [Cladophialophora psammophila CBS 110553]EXJ56220.1 hypothetical protein A1O5_12676 [Cladophialophora psammophila CBS 110553]
MLDTARSIFSGFSDYATTHKTYENAYHQERKTRMECARAYGDLHDQHNRAISDLHGMHKKYQSLHEQLETTQEVVQTLESAIQKQQPVVNANDAIISQSDWDRVEWALERERLEAKIEELENEKSGMEREHHNALANAADHIRAVVQRADELEKLRETSSEQVQALAAESNNNDNHETAAASKPTGQNSRSRKRKAVLK